MNNYYVPLFVPFNIRNKMILEFSKDINEIKPINQYQTLLSYMKEKDILNGITKRRYDNLKKLNRNLRQ